MKIVVMIWLALFCFKSVKSQNKEELTIKLSDPLKAGKLDVELFNGTIKVIGYSGREVIISATGPYYPNNYNKIAGATATNSEAKDGQGKALNVSRQDNVVKIKVEKPRIMNLIIKVPQNFSVVLKVLTAGEIRVEKVDGNHEVSIIAGNITMSAIDGSVLANTKNGNITVDMTSVKKESPLALSNVGGAITLNLPLNSKADVTLRTEFAEVHSDFNISALNAKDISKNSATGKINGGGTNILMRSVGGNIEVKKTK
ncbi:DUF4097 family beta strand repeat-containing protein [Mucilaginibacter sp. HD30]